MHKVKLRSYIGQYLPYFILAPFLTVLETVAELMLPYLMGKIVNNGISSSNSAYIIKMGTLMVVISILGLFIGILSAKASSKASQGFGYNLRQSIFEKIQTFSFADIDRFSTASLVTRCIVDVRQIQEVTIQIVRMLIRAPALLLVSMAICMNLHSGLSVVYWVAIPALFAIIFIIMHLTRPFFRKMQQRIDALNACVRENLIAIRVVKAYVRSDYEKKKFKAANDELKDTSIGASLRIALMHPCSTAIFNLAALALYWFGGRLVGGGQMADGDLLTYIAYLNNILMSVMMFNMVLTRLSRARACVERCGEVLCCEPSIQSASQAACVQCTGALRFENVSFAYSTSDSARPAIKNLSFEINRGEFVAIVGKTGSGKTTLSNLIPRFYDPTHGYISLNGVNLCDYNLKELRSKIGVVAQNSTLFSGKIRENLLWGKAEASDEELREAAADAQALGFINSLAEKWDTYIEQGGVNVSGGQRQRLCIARALLKKPEILILDDSTSALDSATESKIRDILYKKYVGTTILLIAQRISSVQYADRIIVMNNGSIDAIGTHEELLKNNPTYKAIYDSQQEGGAA